MAEFNIPNNDNAADALFLQFAKAMTEYFETLGYGPEQIQVTQNAYDSFHSALGTVVDTKAAARAAVVSKNTIKRESSTPIRLLAQQIKNNPNATDAIKTAFGINITPGPSPTVNVPTQLSATATATGQANLKWNRNGNINGTTFLIEVKVGNNWNLYGTTTRVTFTDPSAAPGVAKYYRVRAQRNTITSAPSNEVVIYAGGTQGTELILAA